MNKQMDNAISMFAKLDIHIPLNALRAETDVLGDALWLRHVHRGGYQGDWSVLALRCQLQHLDAHPILQAFSIEGSQQEWVNLPLLKDCPGIEQVLAQLQCPIRSVRLMRLKAGSSIKPHRDLGLCLEHGQARLHVPIYTDHDVHFFVEGHVIPMGVGELWYFNADAQHEVVNQGHLDRTHLVIDCIANYWLEQCILEGTHHV